MGASRVLARLDVCSREWWASHYLHAAQGMAVSTPFSIVAVFAWGLAQVVFLGGFTVPQIVPSLEYQRESNFCINLYQGGQR